MARPKKTNGKSAGIVKFDDKKKQAYLDLLQQGGRRHASARAVGITPQTVVNHMHADPTFAEAVSLAEMEADDEVEDALRTAAISGNVTAALAWLYSRRPERWQDMRHIKHSLETWKRDLVDALREGRINAAMIIAWRDAGEFSDTDARAILIEAGEVVVSSPAETADAASHDA